MFSIVLEFIRAQIALQCNKEDQIGSIETETVKEDRKCIVVVESENFLGDTSKENAFFLVSHYENQFRISAQNLIV